MYFIKKSSKVVYSLDKIKTNEIVIHHHLGLGDSINCNGLVNFLSTQFKKIYLPAKSNYYEMLNFLYRDNNRVEIFKLENELYGLARNYTAEDFNQISNQEYEQIEGFAKNKELDILRIGFDKLKMPIPKSYYEQLGIPFEYSKEYFKVPYDAEKNIEYSDRLKKIYNSSNKYSLLHLESRTAKFSEVDLKLNNEYSFIKIEENTDVNKNIFYYLKLIAEAQEIHVLNSSIFCLADRVKTSGKLYVYNLLNQKDFKGEMSLLKNWNLIQN
jgi:hypothetical protein